jgi:hypothetical protein
VAATAAAAAPHFGAAPRQAPRAVAPHGVLPPLPLLRRPKDALVPRLLPARAAAVEEPADEPPHARPLPPKAVAALAALPSGEGEGAAVAVVRVPHLAGAEGATVLGDGVPTPPTSLPCEDGVLTTPLLPGPPRPAALAADRGGRALVAGGVDCDMRVTVGVVG